MVVGDGARKAGGNRPALPEARAETPDVPLIYFGLSRMPVPTMFCFSFIGLLRAVEDASPYDVLFIIYHFL